MLPTRHLNLARGSRSVLLIRLALVFLALVVAAGLVLQLSWLQQLRADEEVRLSSQLRSTVEQFNDRLASELERALTTMHSGVETVAWAATRVRWIPGQSDGLIREGERWGYASSARLAQVLGPKAMWRDVEQPGARVWLNPPLLVACDAECTAATIDFQRWSVLDEMTRMFSSLDEGWQVHLVLVGAQGVVMRTLYTHSEALISDTARRYPLLSDVDWVAAPEGSQLSLVVERAGGSAISALDRSHARNIALAILMLVLLGLALWLVLYNVRRQSGLAREQVYFVASASHELRTPLSVIASAADNLADGVVEDLSDVHEYGQLIRDEAQKLNALVNNILQFSESSFSPARRQAVSLNQLLANAIAACKQALQGFELKSDIHDPDLMLEVDQAGIESILVNLIINACKYHQGEQWVAISTRTLRLKPNRHALVVNVSNPIRRKIEADPAQWFEPFHRGRSAIDRGIPGTGIGLAVAMSIARQHGGGLSVHVEPESYVRVSLYLPLDQPSAARVS